MKLERRNVYIKEFWSMSLMERYVYTLVNTYYDSNKPQINPLKWSICGVVYLVVFLIFTMLLPFLSVIGAISLKTHPMPDCKDPMFSGGDDWFISNKWVLALSARKENEQSN